MCKKKLPPGRTVYLKERNISVTIVRHFKRRSICNVDHDKEIFEVKCSDLAIDRREIKKDKNNFAIEKILLGND